MKMSRHLLNNKHSNKTKTIPKKTTKVSTKTQADKKIATEKLFQKKCQRESRGKKENKCMYADM